MKISQLVQHDVLTAGLCQVCEQVVSCITLLLFHQAAIIACSRQHCSCLLRARGMRLAGTTWTDKSDEVMNLSLNCYKMLTICSRFVKQLGTSGANTS